ncbi:hypothetical protein D9M68_931450 [compost metagenome]
MAQSARSQQHHAEVTAGDRFSDDLAGVEELRPFAVLARAHGHHGRARQLQLQLLHEIDRGVLPAEIGMVDRAVVAAALARDGLDSEGEFRLAFVVVGHAVQIPRHLVGEVHALVLPAGIEQVVAGGEPV